MNQRAIDMVEIDGIDFIRKKQRLFEMMDCTHISIAGNKPDVSLVEFDRNKLKDFVKKLKEEVLCEYSAKDS